MRIEREIGMRSIEKVGRESGHIKREPVSNLLYPSLKSLQFNPKPEVLLLYFQREISGLGDTFDEFNPLVHLRPQMGLLCLSAAARSIGVEAVVLDQRAIQYSLEDIASLIRQHEIRTIGVYSSSMHADTNAKMINRLSAITDGVTIVVGGPGHPNYKLFLENGATIVCHGEGEETFNDIIRKVQCGDRDWSSVDGISYKVSGAVIQNKPRSLIENIDDLPFPVRNYPLPLTTYRDYYLMAYRAPYVTMMTVRGCPYSCTFCYSSAQWNFKVRQRSPENVLEEIDYLVKDYGIKFIDFLDDVFGLTYSWVEEFSRKLIERKYDLTYKALINPNTFASKQAKAIELLSKSGCKILGIGMQTADSGTLELVKRTPMSREKLIEAVANAKRNRILTFVSFIVGFPKEPEDAPEQIMGLIDDARPTLIDCYPLMYIKDTKLAKQVASGELSEAWSHDEAVERADRVKRHFYRSPRNISAILTWVLMNNPGWYLRMLKQWRLLLNIAGFNIFRSKKDTRSRYVFTEDTLDENRTF